MKRNYLPSRAGVCSRGVAALLACIAPIAKELQETHPEIADRWYNGSTLDAIAREYDVASMVTNCSSPDEVAESIVRFSLVGMRGGSKVEGFPGLVDQGEYSTIARARKRENIMNYNNTLEGEIGFANMSEEDLRALSRDAATRRLDFRGKPRTLIKQEEAEFAYTLSLEGDYQNSKGVYWKKVVDEVNNQFHSGESVRSIKAVRGMVYKTKTKKEPLV